MKLSAYWYVSLIACSIVSSCDSSSNRWFFPEDCDGELLTVLVVFDDAPILHATGPACDPYESYSSGPQEENILTAKVLLTRDIVWNGYKDDPQISPAGSTLTIDLWLADSGSSAWTFGLLVSGDEIVYMKTTHVAVLNGPSKSCVVDAFCINVGLK